MGKRIKLNSGRSGGQPRSGGAIITGANLRRSSEKPKAPEPEASDDNLDPLSASTPKEAMALAIKFLEGLKPPDVEEPEEEGS